MKIRVFIFFFLWFAFSAKAQSPHRGAFSLSPMAGIILPHHPNMKYLVAGHVPGVELEYGFYADGSKNRHHHYNFPKWGFSINLYDLRSPHLGYAVASRVFYDLPLTRNRIMGLKMEIGAGYVQKPFHIDKNFHNSAIGSHLNAALALTTYAKIPISKKWELNPGIGIHHFSNGAFTLPNSGLNLAMLKIAFAYNPTGYSSIPREENAFEKQKSEWWMGTSLGLKQIPPIGSKRHGVVNLFALWQKRISHKSTFGIEAGLNYNASLWYRNDKIHQKPLGINTRSYLAGTYQLHFDPLAVRLQAGSYLLPLFTADGLIFFRYHLVYKTQRWQYFAGLKSHFAKADNLEVGIAYKIKP